MNWKMFFATLGALLAMAAYVAALLGVVILINNAWGALVIFGGVVLPAAAFMGFMTKEDE